MYNNPRNDLFILDLSSMAWTEVILRGVSKPSKVPHFSCSRAQAPLVYLWFAIMSQFVIKHVNRSTRALASVHGLRRFSQLAPPDGLGSGCMTAAGREFIVTRDKDVSAATDAERASGLPAAMGVWRLKLDRMKLVSEEATAAALMQSPVFS